MLGGASTIGTYTEIEMSLLGSTEVSTRCWLASPVVGLAWRGVPMTGSQP